MMVGTTEESTLAKRRSKPKAIAGLILSAMLLLGVAGEAQASTYTTSAVFKNGIKGTTRNFNGSSITYEATNVSTSVTTSAPNYTVTLWRDNTFGDDEIGEVTCSRRLSCTRSWSSVGSGDYYIRLEKGNDGAQVTIGKIVLEN